MILNFTLLISVSLGPTYLVYYGRKSVGTLEWPHSPFLEALASFQAGNANPLGAFTITEVASVVTHMLKMRNTILRGVKCLDEMLEILGTAGSKPRSFSPRI